MDTSNSKLQTISLLLTVATLIGGCSKHPHPIPTSSESMVLTPSVSIGPVRSGMTIQQIIKQLGEPDRREGNLLAYSNLGFTVIAGKDGTVHSVLCVDVAGKEGAIKKSFAGHTKEGIGIGSSRADIIRVYGEPTKIETQGDLSNYEILRYIPLGLFFTVHEGKVDTMALIFKTTK